MGELKMYGVLNQKRGGEIPNPALPNNVFGNAFSNELKGFGVLDQPDPFSSPWGPVDNPPLEAVDNTAVAKINIPV
ncbi:MAG: hypothetical protein ACREYC_06100 [Gammaproteobacteria bacterium]